MSFDIQSVKIVAFLFLGLLIILGITFGWFRRALHWLFSYIWRWVSSVFKLPELIQKYGISEIKAKRIIIIVGVTQIILILLVAIFEGQAMHFCGSKGDNCDPTEVFFRYRAFSTSFFKLWLVSVVSAPVIAIFCPLEQRRTLLTTLFFAMPIGEYILCIFLAMSGL